ncbi:MAG: LysR family transcriptional regulator ArgP [Pseudomonadota bacterium]
MSNATFPTPQLQALLAILRGGSFEAAASELGVTQSAISQRLQNLEERAGGILVVRAQPCEPTELGARLAAHAEQVVLMERSLIAELGLDDAKPRLRIAVNADSLATWFLPALVGIDARFDIVVDDQDHSATLLRKGEVVAAVTADGDPVQGCDRVALGALRYVPTASPDFANLWFSGAVTADALARAPVLVYNEKDGLQHAWARSVTGSAALGPHHHMPSTTAFVEAARLGLGWGLNPETLVAPALSCGALVDLGQGTRFETPLFWQSARAVKSALLPLTKAVRRVARERLA